MKIIVAGDLHGSWEALNSLISSEKPDIILQVGDFGYWPHRDGWPPIDPDLWLRNTLVYWCEGNHEDHEALAQLRRTKKFQIAPQCFYVPRGSVVELPDVRRVLFFGGSKSSDSDEDLDGIEELGRIDIVISHTAPACFGLRKEPPPGYAEEPWLSKFEEETPKILDRLLDLVKPQEWFFGHYHIHQVGQDRGVNWTALAAAGNGQIWWVEL